MAKPNNMDSRATRTCAASLLSRLRSSFTLFYTNYVYCLHVHGGRSVYTPMRSIDIQQFGSVVCTVVVCVCASVRPVSVELGHRGQFEPNNFDSDAQKTV